MIPCIIIAAIIFVAVGFLLVFRMGGLADKQNEAMKEYNKLHPGKPPSQWQ